MNYGVYDKTDEGSLTGFDKDELRLQDSYKRFASNLPDNIIIWGAGSWGKMTYEWFKERNIEQRVICFIDKNPVLQNTFLYEKRILPPDCLKKLNQAHVIASIIPWHEIYDEMQNNNYTNPLYISIISLLLDVKAPESKERLKLTAHEISDLYSPDAYTHSLIKLNEFLQNSYKTIILPIESVLADVDLMIYRTKPTGYWEAEETKLDRFGEYTLIDAGAYIGDSLHTIANSTNSRLVRAYCFEPDKENAGRLRQFVSEHGLSEIVSIFEMGLGDKDMTANISDAGTRGANIESTLEGETKVVAIDSMNLEVKGKLCIKMDIEGFEIEALCGAAETIKKYKPELAICVYHKDSDIYEIPRLIKSIVPEYNCILRGGWHMVCTASTERYGD